jgi:hypothetical protein
MNPFTVAWRKLTYRNEYSAPDPATGLQVTGGRWGVWTVHDPRVRLYLAARRLRLLHEGLDPVDRALLDPATIALLNTSAELAARYTASYLNRHANSCGQNASRPMAEAVGR